MKFDLKDLKESDLESIRSKALSKLVGGIGFNTVLSTIAAFIDHLNYLGYEIVKKEEKK